MALDLSMPILVVDDYQTMVRIIRNLLKQLGFEDVDDASDGTTALAKLKQKKYGLVISDWNMEPMTGYELLRHVRADENLRAMPFIMVTAESNTENVIAAKKAGVNNYIVKPFNAQTLKTKIEGVCGACPAPASLRQRPYDQTKRSITASGRASCRPSQSCTCDDGAVQTGAGPASSFISSAWMPRATRSEGRPNLRAPAMSVRMASPTASTRAGSTSRPSAFAAASSAAS